MMEVFNNFVEWLNTWQTLQFWTVVLANGFTIASVWLMGNKSVWSPLLGALAGIPWFGFILINDLWEVFPMTLVITTMQVRNTFLWFQNKGLDTSPES